MGEDAVIYEAPFMRTIRMNGHSWILLNRPGVEEGFADPRASLAIEAPLIASTSSFSLSVSYWGRIHEGSFAAPDEPPSLANALRRWLGRRREWSTERPPAEWGGWAWTRGDPAASDPRAYRCCAGAAYAVLGASAGEGASFAVAILEAGPDPAPSLIAADWLEARGEIGKAHWVRGIVRIGPG